MGDAADDGFTAASDAGNGGGCKHESNIWLLNYATQCPYGQQNEEVLTRNCEVGDSSGSSSSVYINPQNSLQHEVGGHCTYSKRMRLADNKVHISSIPQVSLKKAWCNLSEDVSSLRACNSINFTERPAGDPAAADDDIACKAGVGGYRNGSKCLTKPSYVAQCPCPPRKNEQLKVLTSNFEEVDDGSTTIAGSSLTTVFVHPQDAACLQHEFDGLFKCSRRTRLADNDNDADIPLIPQVLEQSATGHGIESDNEASIHNMISQIPSAGQSSGDQRKCDK